jgi:predicted RNA-binding Zn-ribbon protein involved in translation (DUF1610 family)
MEVLRCPECGSEKLIKYGNRVFIARKLVSQYLCKDCGRRTVHPVITEETVNMARR